MAFVAGNDYNVRCSPSANRPACNVLGGVLHSQPIVVGHPNAFITDEAYNAFSAQYKTRPEVMYVETLDGLLHAFDSTVDFAGAGPIKNELFAFVPPIVLPTLFSNYPGGDRQLLDSSPVVKDVVWERLKTDVGAAAAIKWHTMLVAGAQNGYVGLEVTDPEIGTVQAGKEPLVAPVGWVAPTTGTPQAVFETARVPGPHFMWQVSSIEDLPGNNGRGVGKGFRKKNGTVNILDLFGDNVGKPAITTLYFDPSGGANPREIGVAILPGGIDTTGAVKGKSCKRATGNSLSSPQGIGNYTAAGFAPIQAFDPGGTQYKPRANVRQWAAGGCDKSVGGRDVVIVRLDTGEIIRLFGRALQDVPNNVTSANVVNTPLDSPMTGTPMPWPQEVGSVATEFYIGDADETVWRFDVSSTNPTSWHGNIFYDTQNNIVDTGGTPELDGSPIAVDPVLSTDAGGHVVISVANGDQENFSDVLSGAVAANSVASLSEAPISAAPYLTAQVNWYYKLPGNGERVTGPMAVFGGVHYFATYAPANGSNAACTNGTAYLFGLDYTKPQTGGLYSSGGAWRSPPGLQNVSIVNDFIPGVTIQAALTCASTSASTDYLGARTALSFTSGYGSAGAPGFALNVMSSSGTPIGGIGGAGVPVISPPQPAVIDSWAAVIE